MKVTKQQAPEVFQPVTVSIVFETARELEIFREMIGTDHSVPVMIYDNEEDKRLALGRLMGQIYRTL